MIAGPGLLALENVERLSEDHANARVLANELDAIEGLSVPEPDTNIVLVHTDEAGLTAAELIDRCEDEGVRASEFGEYTVRFCTHLDVDESDVETAVSVVRDVL